MTQKKLTANQGNPIYGKGEIIRTAIRPLFMILFFAAAIPFHAYSAEPTYPISSEVYTTRQQTVRPVSIPGSPHLAITDVDQYASAGYSSYTLEAGVDTGPLLPDGSDPGTYNPVETLLTFFSISDTHITDKESPAQLLFLGLPGTFGTASLPAYSPIMLSTTHVLDAAVQTINVLHARTPFDFGIGLGDPANNNMFIGLRWHIDVLDGKWITPSSGAHLGADSIDYQMPYQAAGLNKSIPWYQVIGNHDQYWSGGFYPNDYLRGILVGENVLNMGFEGGFPSLDARGIYMGVIDGSTPYGTIIDYGLASSMPQPVVAADSNRYALTTDTSSSLNWMAEFFNTATQPQGHGFTQANLNNDFVSYSFEPRADVPIKVIALDDTCKYNPYGTKSSYSQGCLDQERYDWLVNELEQGQAEGKLMIIAAHVPVGPQANNADAYVPPGGVSNNTVVPMYLSTCRSDPAAVGVPCASGVPIENNDPVPPYTVVTDAMLLDTLHSYPNLILWMAGHRHQNTVTPQPAPADRGPEYGFWEVETASLRDFPQQFRTFRIVRNDNNTVSIFITNVDPAVQGNSPAAKSRGYAIAANRISRGVLTDTGSYAYNAELIKPLPYSLTVKVIGSGVVKSSPYSGVNCSAERSCSSIYLNNTAVTLVATAMSGATFAGWSGCDSSAGGSCSVTTNAARYVTAAFTCNNGIVKNKESAVYYPTIQAAYDSAVYGQSVLIQGFGPIMEFTGGLTLDRNISVTLSGGYLCNYLSNPGSTVVEGPVVIKSGTVKIENLTIR